LNASKKVPLLTVELKDQSMRIRTLSPFNKIIAIQQHQTTQNATLAYFFLMQMTIVVLF